MYQSFEEASTPAASGDRVKAIQLALKSKRLKAFLVPHSDQHQNEFLPPAEERLAWLTGFTGSAGVAIVTEKGSALFVDGRYILQAPKQVDTEIFEVLQVPEAKPSSWLVDKLGKGNAVGYDPALHTVKEIERLTKALSAAGIRLNPVDENPIDAQWGEDRPEPSSTQIVLQSLEFAGRRTQDNITEVQAELADAGHDAVLLTVPDSVCWLFNIRGGDIRHTPIALAFAIVPASGRPTLFIDVDKVGDPVRTALNPFIDIAPLDQLDEKLKSLATDKAKVRLDPEYFECRILEIAEDGILRCLGHCHPVMGSLPFVVFLLVAIPARLASDEEGFGPGRDTLTRSVKILRLYEREGDRENDDNGGDKAGYLPAGHLRIDRFRFFLDGQPVLP